MFCSCQERRKEKEKERRKEKEKEKEREKDKDKASSAWAVASLPRFPQAGVYCLVTFKRAQWHGDLQRATSLKTQMNYTHSSRDPNISKSACFTYLDPKGNKRQAKMSISFVRLGDPQTKSSRSSPFCELQRHFASPGAAVG